MFKKTIAFFLCLTLIASVSLVLAGGPPAYYKPYKGACGPPGCAPANPCAYWGDAPFPGFCGGVVALPFLVVGSLLGGNPAGPCGPPPSPKTGCVQYAHPHAKRYYAQPAAGIPGVLGGIPGMEVANGLFGSVMNGAGLLN